RNVADVFPGVSKFGLFEVFRRVWQTGQAEWHPISLYQDKRIAGWRENYVYKLPSGEIVAVYADITARKQAEEALQKSQEQFQTITETSPIPIVMTDKTDSKIIFANSAMAKLIGLSKEEFIGKKSTDFYAEPAQRAELIELLKKNKNVQNKELAFKDTKGKILCLLASFTEMMFESKDIILSALLDITERKKAAAELQKSREKLIVSEKLASLGRVSAGVAHELNNPLAAVLVMTQFLIKKTNLEDPNLKPLKIMEESILRCKDIVQNLLGFARQSDLVLKNIDLSGPLKYTFLILNNELTQKKIKVNIDLPLDLPKIKFDQGQLSQVFINIISNSIDALDEGGYITVQAQSDEQNQHLILTFADNGAGIASHDLPYIFEPFYTTKLDGKGTGLGLSITYNIMRQHQALIECESKKGEGAVFTLKFPLAPLETRAKNEAVTMAA
ncbi:MAG: PAS domain S-box protein, partial [Candidatus Margulisbacteria bacterium]|nr:PAS domain S-box protein [Candidatus Margulisiibacteriota bacterium]